MSELEEKLAAVQEAPTTAKISGTLSDNPNEMAATLLHLYTPKFLAGVDTLSSNALRRVLKRLVTYPLNEKAYKPTSTGEANVFAIGDRLLEAKFLLQMANYANIVQKSTEEELAAEEQGESDDSSTKQD